jgi:CRP-like cAMP-binding protein
MRYNKFDEGAVILRQGHPPESFYFVLSGTLLVFKKEYDESTKQLMENIIMTFGPDQIFGDLALLADKCRLATVVSSTPVELLSIERSSYRTILDSLAKDEAKEKERLAECIPLLQTFRTDFQSVGSVCHIKDFPPNFPILMEGQISDSIYLITRGHCRLVKAISLVREVGYHGKSHMTKYIPHTKLKDNQRVLSNLLPIDVLKQGQFFGLGNLMSYGKKHALKEVIQSRQTVEEVSTVTCDRVQCLVLGRVDFLRFVTDESVNYINNYYRKRIPINLIEQNYLEHVNWTIQKARIIESTVASVRRKKKERVELPKFQKI